MAGWQERNNLIYLQHANLQHTGVHTYIVHTVHIIHIHTYICVARVAHIPSLPGMYNEFIRIHAHTYCCTCNVILQKEDRDEETKS